MQVLVFIGLKLAEIGAVVLGVGLVVGIGKGIWWICENISWPKWLEKVWFVFGMIYIGGFILYWIGYWFYSNWQWAGRIVSGL